MSKHFCSTSSASMHLSSSAGLFALRRTHYFDTDSKIISRSEVISRLKIAGNDINALMRPEVAQAGSARNHCDDFDDFAPQPKPKAQSNSRIAQAN